MVARQHDYFGNAFSFFFENYCFRSICMIGGGRGRRGVDGAWKKREDRAAMALEGKKQEGLADGGEALVAVRGNLGEGKKKKKTL